MREISVGLEGTGVENLNSFPKISYLIPLASSFTCWAKPLGGLHPSPEPCRPLAPQPELEVSSQKIFLEQVPCWGITQLGIPLLLLTCLRDFRGSCLD